VREAGVGRAIVQTRLDAKTRDGRSTRGSKQDEEAPWDSSACSAIDAMSRDREGGIASVTHRLDSNDQGEPPPPALPQSRIGRYVVVDVLGAGGFGTVYRAYDPQLDRFIALKIVRLVSGSADEAEEGRARALREAQTLAKFDHPNVVPVFDAGVAGDDVFIAMALVDGQTLATWLASSKRTTRAILDAYGAAGRGLEAAHRAGMVHRDFKPENVFVTAEGAVRVLDFGLARIVDADLAPDPVSASGETSKTSARAFVTRAGRRVGTPAYMAPEQHRGEACDARSDQFSFCVAVYRALTGEHPFEGSSAEELVQSAAVGAVRPFSASARVAPHVQSALLRGLNPDRDRRFAAMGELLHELARDPSRRQRGIFVAASVAALVAGVSVLAARRTVNRPPPCSAAASISDASKERIRGRLTASGQAYVRDSFERLRARLDEYASKLARAGVGFCEEERAAGVSALSEDRKRCLTERAYELSGMVGALGHGSPTIIESAVGAADRLTAIEECRTPDQNTWYVPLPAEPVLRDRVASIARRFTEIRLDNRITGDSHLNELDRVTADARATDYPRLTAVVSSLYVNVLIEAGKFAESETVARESVRAAAKARWTAGWITRTETVALTLALQRKTVEARLYIPFLESVVDLQADDPRRQAGTLNDLAQVHKLFGENMLAAETAVHAATLLSQIDAPVPLYVWAVAAEQFMAASRVGDADAVLARAIPEAERRLGPHHPDLAWLLLARASVDTALWRFPDAHAAVARSSVIAAQTDAETNGDSELAEGVASLTDGELGDAVASLEKALRLREALVGPEDKFVADVVSALAVARADAGRLTEAMQLSERALTIWRKVFGDNNADLDYGIEVDALVRIRSNQLGVARQELEGSLRTRRARGNDPLLLATARTRLSEVELREGHVVTARALADEALAGFTEPRSIPGDLVEALVAQSDVALADGDTAVAAASLQRALGVLEPIARPGHPLLARVRARLGDVRLSTGDAAGAIPLYDAAIGALTGATHDPIDLLTARFGHARAVWTLDPTRHPEARAEAREVLAGASVKEVMLPDLRRAVAAWLIAHP
jgi:tetratricopeptide (TPR) repeat protein